MAEGRTSGFSLPRYLATHPDVRRRLEEIRRISARVRTNTYQITRECNLRCMGCWYYAHDLDKTAADETDPARIRDIVRRHHAEGVTHALLVGGEPAIHPDRIAAFVEELPYVSVATNGYRALPRQGFENVTIGLALFAGLASDDRYRAIAAGGRRFTGLFQRALGHYRNDTRVTVMYALTEDAIDEIEPAVEAIGRNGNRVYFSYYRRYGQPDATALDPRTQALLDEAHRVRERHPGIVLSHPYYIDAVITGGTEWARFGYDTCATVSVDHPDNAARLANGRPVLPHFRSVAQDMVTTRLCAAAADCETCRDSLAISSWLLVNFRERARDEASLLDWISYAESYWGGFYWSPMHWSKRPQAVPAAAE